MLILTETILILTETILILTGIVLTGTIHSCESCAPVLYSYTLILYTFVL